MNGNSIGKAFKVTSFGESHGRCVGAIIDGCPAGLKLDTEKIQRDLDRRKPGQSTITTARREEDKLEIISGVLNEFTTSAPICMLTWNKDVISSGYEQRRFTVRPGHADYTAFMKYGGFEDYRGGGRFSARITTGFVMAGALAKQLLSLLNIEILAHTVEIGGIKAREMSVDDIRKNTETNEARCADSETAKKMIERIKQVRLEKDSLGGLVEGIALNVPVGLGEPVFDNLDSELAKALFAIPAVKAVEFGLGFQSSRLKGSENNDIFVMKKGKIVTKTNNSGGILGGLSNGMPIVVKVGFKPISSIPKEQKTINMKEMKETEIKSIGRFDPCPVPRAIPIVESMMAIVLCDFALRSQLIPRVIK